MPSVWSKFHDFVYLRLRLIIIYFSNWNLCAICVIFPFLSDLAATEVIDNQRVSDWWETTSFLTVFRYFDNKHLRNSALRSEKNESILSRACRLRHDGSERLDQVRAAWDPAWGKNHQLGRHNNLCHHETRSFPLKCHY